MFSAVDFTNYSHVSSLRAITEFVHVLNHLYFSPSLSLVLFFRTFDMLFSFYSQCRPLLCHTVTFAISVSSLAWVSTFSQFPFFSQKITLTMPDLPVPEMAPRPWPPSGVVPCLCPCFFTHYLPCSQLYQAPTPLCY